MIEEVVSSGEPILIARDGRSIAMIEPIERKRGPKSRWGARKGQIEILGDVIEPVDVEWEANR